MIPSTLLVVLILLTLNFPVWAQSAETLSNTAGLQWKDDLSARMVAGIDRFLTQELTDSVQTRQRYWSRDFSSAEAYNESLEANRQRFRRVIGLVDARLSAGMEHFSPYGSPPLLVETDQYRISRVRWPVLDGVFGEGLLVEPKREPLGQVVALPDADNTPEQLVGLSPGIHPRSQFARRMAENGYRVIVPTLINRSSRFSGNPDLNTDRLKMTNMPHREWLYRMSYEMGRHLIGYEVQKVLAAVDWLQEEFGGKAGIGIAGYAEGGLIALYSAALDTRISSCLVSGYFGPRERVWEEPIYRNVWSLLHEFGDAEIASMVLPRNLVIEHSATPMIEGRPPAQSWQANAAAPGRLATPAAAAVKLEFERLDKWQQQLPTDLNDSAKLIPSVPEEPVGPGSTAALDAFLAGLTQAGGIGTESAQTLPQPVTATFDQEVRQSRQLKEIENHLQHILRVATVARDKFLLEKVPYDSADRFAEGTKSFRKYFWEEVIGKVDHAMLPPNPRSRLRYDRPRWTGYDVVLDVWPDVFAWGILLIPKDLKPGERRPVVVAQHGLEGLPKDVIEEESRSFRAYQAFAARLADRGFIVFAPHNPYRGQDLFRVLQFKANPLKLSLFSFIVGQHQQIINWLKTLSYVDQDRIAFYGLSYGGKTAMRVPAIVEDYCLSICSGDFNEWIWKNATVDWRNSYMFTKEYEMPEFRLGITFNYAEMAYLIFPRPFMVERGHRDGVGLDEWVAHEYAKVRRLYDELGQGDKTEIEFFNGNHEINGKGAFDFLHRHLDWPQP